MRHMLRPSVRLAFTLDRIFLRANTTLELDGTFPGIREALTLLQTGAALQDLCTVMTIDAAEHLLNELRN